MTNKKNNENNENNDNKRSLGFSVFFSGSDLSGFKKQIHNENDVFGNTKIILKEDDINK
jgi:hypothetical protein